MPTRSIYIRKVDLPLWEACSDKTDKVSQMLNGQTLPPVIAPPGTAEAVVKLRPSAGVMWSPISLNEPVVTARNKEMKFCKHSAVIGFCKKGCK